MDAGDAIFLLLLALLCVIFMAAGIWRAICPKPFEQAARPRRTRPARDYGAAREREASETDPLPTIPAAPVENENVIDLEEWRKRQAGIDSSDPETRARLN